MQSRTDICTSIGHDAPLPFHIHDERDGDREDQGSYCYGQCP